MHDFAPLAQDRSVSVRIADQVLKRILSGEFPVGAKLPSEVELARQFGVSRPSVREALGALQFVGYVESVRGSGSRVISRAPSMNHAGLAPTEITSREIIRLFEARLHIEPLVAALAATDPDWEKLEEAEGLIEGMSLVVNKSTLHGETDLRVHRALAEVCQNSYMTTSALRLLDIAASPQLRSTRDQAWSDRVLPPIWGSQHQDIVQAIRQRNSTAAAQASWDHLVSSALNALTVIAQDPDVDNDVVDRFQLFLDEGLRHRGPLFSDHDHISTEATNYARKLIT